MFQNVGGPNDRFVEDASFIKIRELSVRYTFDQSQLKRIGFLDRAGIEQATPNAIGRNLITFTDFTGFDPEGGLVDEDGGGSSVIGCIVGVDRYPNFRTLSLSLDLVF